MSGRPTLGRRIAPGRAVEEPAMNVAVIRRFVVERCVDARPDTGEWALASAMRPCCGKSGGANGTASRSRSGPERSALVSPSLAIPRHAMRRRAYRREVLCPALLCGLMALAAVPAQAQPATAGVDRAISEALQQLLDAAPSHVLDNQPLDLATLRRFYGARGAEPAWAGSGDAAERAKLALSALAAADLDGLNPADYHPAALAATAAPADAAAAAAYDLVLTDAFLRYAHDMRLGRVAPHRVFDDVNLPAEDFDAAAALEAALKGEGLAGLIAELPPPYAEYARLKDALKHYRELADKGGWPEIPPGDELRLDSHDPRLATLRQHLAVEDTALAAQPAHAVKGDLGAALRRFQTRNGLAVDGRIGAKTFAALNVGADERINQIIANMERWRWMPRQLEERYVAVNAADGELRVIDHGAVILASKVVVGDEKHQSPILRAMAVSITVNPPWNVPPSIAQKEMLPKLKQDSSYLERENIVIVHGPAGDPYGVNVDWSAIPDGHFPYRLRQLPGPGNSLGGVKIEMPNPFERLSPRHALAPPLRARGAQFQSRLHPRRGGLAARLAGAHRRRERGPGRAQGEDRGRRHPSSRHQDAASRLCAGLDGHREGRRQRRVPPRRLWPRQAPGRGLRLPQPPSGRTAQGGSGRPGGTPAERLKGLAITRGCFKHPALI